MDHSYYVQGMTCGHCVGAVSEEVGALPGVSKVSVDLARGVVHLSSEQEVPAEDVRAAVATAGYEVTGPIAA